MYGIFALVQLIVTVLRAEARDHLKKLSESWNESVKRNSLSNESPKPIDKLGVADTAKAEEKPAKKAVPARNNWSHLVDSESEPEQDELVLETDEGESQGEEGEETENEFVDDEVEVVENYESGDSMDEEEKREIEGLFARPFAHECNKQRKIFEVSLFFFYFFVQKTILKQVLTSAAKTQKMRMRRTMMSMKMMDSSFLK